MVAAIISEGKPWAIWKTVTPEGWGLTEVVPSGYGSVEDQIFSAKNYFLSYFAGFSATSQQWRVRGMVSSSWSFTFSKRPFCQVALLLLIIFFKSWGKELNQFRPPSSSNGLCLLFCLYPIQLQPCVWTQRSCWSISWRWYKNVAFIRPPSPGQCPRTGGWTYTVPKILRTYTMTHVRVNILMEQMQQV